MAANAVWNVQNLLHSSNSLALPVALLLTASSLVVYKHMTDTREGFDSLKTFLVLIVIQMVPLIVLEMKIMSCPDPVQILSRFGPKVLLMHACFLFLRVLCCSAYEPSEWLWNVVRFIGCCVALRKGFGFRLSFTSAYENGDVWSLACLGLLTATGMKYIDSQVTGRPINFNSSVTTASDYIEILAFVPAVWIVLRANAPAAAQREYSDPRTRAVYFFAFLVTFYFIEDILSAVDLFSALPLAAAGHIVHFLLLVDFAGFLLAHIYNPEKLKGELLRWLPVSDAYSV